MLRRINWLKNLWLSNLSNLVMLKTRLKLQSMLIMCNLELKVGKWDITARSFWSILSKTITNSLPISKDLTLRVCSGFSAITTKDVSVGIGIILTIMRRSLVILWILIGWKWSLKWVNLVDLSNNLWVCSRSNPVTLYPSVTDGLCLRAILRLLTFTRSNLGLTQTALLSHGWVSTCCLSLTLNDLKLPWTAQIKATRD